jgi:polar amino acid transport system substrate-binding protein
MTIKITRRNLVRATAVGLLAGACRSDSKPERSKSVLRVGMDLSYPPFEMQDTAGKPDGVSVRLAEALAVHLGRPLKIVPMEFSGLIPALKTGNLDVVLSSMTKTEERSKSIAFSNPYAKTGLALLIRKTSDLQSVDGLKTLARPITVAVKAATTGETWALKNLASAKRVVFEDPAACVLEVVQGRADAFIYDQLSVFKYAAKNAAETRALLTPFAEESWAIGLALGSDVLRAEVNAFLESFRTQGGFTKLGAQYLKEEKSALESLGIPFILQ